MGDRRFWMAMVACYLSVIAHSKTDVAIFLAAMLICLAMPSDKENNDG